MRIGSQGERHSFLRGREKRLKGGTVKPNRDAEAVLALSREVEPALDAAPAAAKRKDLESKAGALRDEYQRIVETAGYDDPGAPAASAS